MSSTYQNFPITSKMFLGMMTAMISMPGGYLQSMALPPKGTPDLLLESSEATAAVLRESWVSGCSIIYVIDGTTHSTSFRNLMEILGKDFSAGVFEVKSPQYDIHLQETLQNISQIEKSSRFTTIVLASDDPDFLQDFTKDAIERELLVWPTRLLVVTRLALDHLHPLQESLSLINAMVIVLEEGKIKRCIVYMYVPYSQRSIVVASWNPTFGLTYAEGRKLFPDKFKRLTDGANMTVVGINFPLHMFITKVTRPDGETVFSFKGPLVKVLEILAHNMNFTYNLVPSSDGGWGFRFPNGSWNGMIGMIIRKEVNFGLGPFGMTYIRSKVIDYTNPLIIDYGRIFGKRGDTKVDPWGFLMPLTPSVWAATFGTLFLVLFVATVAYRVEWTLPEMSPKVPLATYVRAFLQQDIFVPSESGWEKILVGVWMLSVFILIECYSTNLISLLAVRYISEPYQSIRSMLDDPTLKMVVVANTVYAQHIADVESGIFYEVKQKGKEGRILYIGTPEYMTATDSLVSRGDHVLLSPLIIMKIFLTEDYMENGNCKFYVSRETFLPQTFCMVVPKNSPLRRPINEGIRAVVEGGLYEYWLDNTIPNAKSCKDPPTKITVKAPLSFYNLWGLFVVFATGYGVSFLVLLLEILIAKLKKKRSKTNIA